MKGVPLAAVPTSNTRATCSFRRRIAASSSRKGGRAAKERVPERRSFGTPLGRTARAERRPIWLFQSDASSRNRPSGGPGIRSASDAFVEIVSSTSARSRHGSRR